MTTTASSASNASSVSSQLPLTPATMRQKAWFAWELLCNLLLGGMFLQFALINGYSLAESFRLSTLVLLGKVTTDVLFYLIRRPAREVSVAPYDWLIGVAGTWSVVMFRPAEASHDFLLAQGVQLLGLALQVYAMLSLNRSIGIVAANRGVQTGGMYRFVRHPLYFSYLVAYAGYVANHPSMYNCGVYLIAGALWVLRILAEEKLLLNDPQYQEFAKRTRWRLVPGVF